MRLTPHPNEELLCFQKCTQERGRKAYVYPRPFEKGKVATAWKRGGGHPPLWSRTTLSILTLTPVAHERHCTSGCRQLAGTEEKPASEEFLANGHRDEGVQKSRDRAL
jgi:hypothetical protein